MKFSVNIADFYSDIDFRSKDADEMVKKMGLQLGAIEDVIDYRNRYDGIVVVKVVSCEKHPDADKLNVCLVDDGGVTANVDRDSSGLVQVVCGAPNAAADVYAVWVPPGRTVPSTADSEPFILGARELRGVMSNGMLASAHELDINDDHSGIVLVNPNDADEITPGMPVAELYNLDDVVIDCENKMFTHRPDCFGNLGIAREVAGIYGEQYTSPDWYLAAPQYDVVDEVELNVVDTVQDVVPRFTCIAMKNVQMGQSPLRVQAYLKRVGIKPINNVVDATNYIMHFTGQPIHAFDLDKLREHSDDLTLQPRMANEGEKLVLLGGKEIELNKTDIVIATDKKAVALAGIMGGAETEVDENTTSILIECANFDMYTVRRSSMRHGLFTDALTRFNKGQSPLQNDRVLKYAMQLMNEFAGAEQSSRLYDITAFDVKDDNLNHVDVTVEFINSRLGTTLNVEQIGDLLRNVEFTVESDGEMLHVIAPFWRMDIAIKEDIVEEVGRLHGYNNIPVVLPARSSKAAERNARLVFKQQIRDQLVRAGANEVLTYSFVHGDLMRNTGTDPDKYAYHIRNAISPELQYYRTSLVPSLLAKVRANIKAGAGNDNNSFAIFELGKAHVKGHNEESEPDLPAEMRRLAFVVAADGRSAKAHVSDAYYMAKMYLDMVIGQKAKYVPLDTNEYPLTAPYQIGRSAAVMSPANERPFAVVGEFSAKTKRALKLPDYCAGFEIDIDLLMDAWESNKYVPMSQFPSVTQDATFEVSADTAFGSVSTLFDAELQTHAATGGMQIQVEPVSIYQAEGSDKKRYSFRVTATHMQRTLQSEAINSMIDTIAVTLKDKLHATRI